MFVSVLDANGKAPHFTGTTKIELVYEAQNVGVKVFRVSYTHCLFKSKSFHVRDKIYYKTIFKFTVARFIKSAHSTRYKRSAYFTRH